MGADRAEAMDVFYRDTVGGLRGFVASFGLDEHDCQDVMHDAYAVVLDRWDHPEMNDARRRSILRTTARWRVMRLFRDRRGLSTVLHLGDAQAEVQAAGRGPAEELEAEEDRAELQAALATLPATRRRLVLARALRGVPYERLAAETGASPTALRQDYHRAVRVLRRTVSRVVAAPLALRALRRARAAHPALLTVQVAAVQAVAVGVFVTAVITAPLSVPLPRGGSSPAAAEPVVNAVAAAARRIRAVLPAARRQVPRSAAPSRVRPPRQRLLPRVPALLPEDPPGPVDPSLCVDGVNCTAQLPGTHLTISAAGQEQGVHEGVANLCPWVPSGQGVARCEDNGGSYQTDLPPPPPG
jgi:RNA polymerase sigma factor (sigma-70 family)